MGKSYCSCLQRKRLRAVPAQSSLRLSHMLLAAMLGVASVRAMQDALRDDVSLFTVNPASRYSEHTTDFKPDVPGFDLRSIKDDASFSDMSMTIASVQTEDSVTADSENAFKARCQRLTSARRGQSARIDREGKFRYDFDEKAIDNLKERLTPAEHYFKDDNFGNVSRLLGRARLVREHQNELQAYARSLNESRSEHDELLKQKLAAQDRPIDLTQTSEKLIALMETLRRFEQIYKGHKSAAQASDKKMKAKRKILENVKAAAIKRNRNAYANQAKVDRAARQKIIKADHKVTRHDRDEREARNKWIESEEKMNGFREVCRRPTLNLPEIAKDHYVNFRPKNSFTGWFTGNGYAVSERERLGFSTSCPTCKNTGNVDTKNKDECIFPPTWGTWGRHVHSCKKPCPQRRHNKHVYLKIALLKKNDETESYHPVDTECKLMGIETKSQLFNGVPQATITIGDETYVVKSTDLSREKDTNLRSLPDAANAVVNFRAAAAHWRDYRAPPRSQEGSSLRSSRRSGTSSSRHSGSRRSGTSPSHNSGSQGSSGCAVF